MADGEFSKVIGLCLLTAVPLVVVMLVFDYKLKNILVIMYTLKVHEKHRLHTCQTKSSKWIENTSDVFQISQFFKNQ